MALLKLARLGHPVLRRRADEVAADELASPAFQAFIDDLADTMRDGDGVGVAAPQVHVSRRVFLVEVKKPNPRYPGQAEVPLAVVVNPVIVDHSAEADEDWEGCLSIPDLRGKVPRWRSLTLRGQDRAGRGFEVRAEGFFARVIQHELDHLDGVLFLDRMRDFSTLTYLREFQRYWATAAVVPTGAQEAPRPSVPRAE